MLPLVEAFQHNLQIETNHGDLKATQGDTGHAQVDMITKIYAHILDEDRKINAQRFESSFYAEPDLRAIHPPKESAPVMDIAQFIAQLQKAPELANMLMAVLQTQQGGKG